MSEVGGNSIRTAVTVNSTGERVLHIQMWIEGRPSAWIEYSAAQLDGLITLLEKGARGDFGDAGDMSEEFQGAIAWAAIIFAVLTPLAYCEVHRGPKEHPELTLIRECMQLRGRWVRTWFRGGYCEFGEEVVK